VSDGKQSHAAFAEIDAQGIHLPAIGEDAHASVEPVSPEAAGDRKATFEKHADSAAVWLARGGHQALFLLHPPLRKTK